MEPEEQTDELDLSNKFYWNAMTLSNLQTKLTDQITYLDLYTNHVNLESASIISEFMRSHPLKGLSLVQCHLTTRASKLIFLAVGYSQLKELYVDNNILVPESCAVLAEAINKGPPLEILSMCGCNIPSEGIIPIAKALPHLKNLVHLRLESNSIFDPGAEALAVTMKDCSYTHLSVADNEIWQNGMNILLGEIAKSKRIISLDLSYNIVDLDVLTDCLIKSPTISELAISGCKVKESQVAIFLENLTKSSLEILIADGFNHNVLPVSWPKVADTTFSKKNYADLLISTIVHSKTLNDVRIGFMEFDKLSDLNEELQRFCPDKKVCISLQDFGRTGNCWCCSFPGMNLSAPTDILKWSSPITQTRTASVIGSIFQHVDFNGGHLTNLDLSSCNLNDQCANALLKGLKDLELNILDLSSNNFGDAVVDGLIGMFSTCSVIDFRAEKTALTDEGLSRLVHYFAKEAPELCPKELSFTVCSEEKGQLSRHLVFAQIADAMSAGAPIESLSLDGIITPEDVCAITDAMAPLPQVRELIFETDLMSEYETPDPTIDPVITASFKKLVESAYRAIAAPGAVTKMKDFRFPLLTEIFIYCDSEMMSQWQAIEAKMEENRN